MTADPQADTERLRRRADVREQAARRDLELQPAILAEQDIRDSESRCDGLAADHQTLCQPWQDELAALEKTAISRIGRHEPPNAEEDERRAELTKLIAAATGDLEKAIAAEREVQGVARRKARLARQGRPPSGVILMKLAQPPLACPRLLAESHVCKQRAKWAEARKKAAEKSLEIHRYNERETAAGRMSGDMQSIQRKIAFWQAECDAVEAEQATARAESERIYRTMIDE